MTTETLPRPTPGRPRAPAARGASRLAVLALLLAAACGTTPPTRWFVLVPTAPVPGSLTRPDLAVAIEPVVLPASLQRPQLVTRIGQHELHLADFERWAEPLEDNMGAVLAEDLGRLLGTDRVSSGAGQRLQQVQRRVSVEVLRLDGEPGDELVLVARWVLRDASGEPLGSGRTRHAEPLADDAPETFVRSLNLCVGALARDVASALVAAGGPLAGS